MNSDIFQYISSVRNTDVCTAYQANATKSLNRTNRSFFLKIARVKQKLAHHCFSRPTGQWTRKNRLIGVGVSFETVLPRPSELSKLS